MYPKREEFQWRPSAILCKRFDLIDPFMGKVTLLGYDFITYELIFLHKKITTKFFLLSKPFHSI